MSRLAWTTAPNLQRTVSIPDPPETEDVAVQDWMRRVKQAVEELARPEAQLQQFLDDLVNAVKEYDRDTINGLDAVSETAGAAYTANEQTMLNNLKTLANGLRTNL